MWCQGGRFVRFTRHRGDVMLSSSRDFSSDDVIDLSSVAPRQYRKTEVHVDFDALAYNIENIRELVSPAMLAVVVKGNGYGHGMSAVAQQLQKLDVDMLCVATAESCLTLRKKGITKPILALSELPYDAIVPCYEHDITFTVYTTEMIDYLASIATKERPAHVHLKVDTGMNRVGCETEQALEFARHIHAQENLVFEGLFTHFATADDIVHTGTVKQLKEFESVLDEIEMAGLTPPIIHSANSAAALSLASTRFSMVRVGLAAYGVYPDPRMKDIIDLRLVLSFTTSISYVKKLYEGESVSYGWRYTAEKDTRLATLHAGYSDGVPRNLGLNGGTVIIRGRKCPIVGAVTMDMMMVDVGDLDVKAGDHVTLLGTNGGETISPIEWADHTGTIPYEIMCCLGERLPRIYD